MTERTGKGVTLKMWVKNRLSKNQIKGQKVKAVKGEKRRGERRWKSKGLGAQ